MTNPYDMVGANRTAPSTVGPFRFQSDLMRLDPDLGLWQDFLLSANLSPAKSWNIGIVVPVLPSSSLAGGQGPIAPNSAIRALLQNLEPGLGPVRSTDRIDAIGVGDIFFQTWYNFTQQPGRPNFAIFAQATLPTGDKDGFLGAGETEVQTTLAASRSYGLLTPHMDFGFDSATGDSPWNYLLYATGLGIQVHPRLALGLDAASRLDVSGSGSSTPPVDLVLGAKWNPFRSLLFNAKVRFKEVGLQASAFPPVDLVVKAKSSPFRSLFLNTNVRVQEPGPHRDTALSAGVEYTFEG